MSFSELTGCVAGRWQPGIGDPHVMGWVTVAAYLIAAGLAVLVLRRGMPLGRRAAGFWGVLAVTLMLLAVNKQLDLQSALTAAGRCFAMAGGWYEDRHIVQRLFIVGIAATGLALVGIVLALLCNELRRNALAVVGLGFVIAFVLIRAVGFHGFDALIGLSVANIRLNRFLELSGPVLISVNALALIRA